ncbi:MAG: acyltransferase family protein, partial [Ilumatobacteraceae bacterium]
MNKRSDLLTYIPSLDGIRALSVLAVIVYHANKIWLPGGFLGVEVFFVISGYLITL